MKKLFHKKAVFRKGAIALVASAMAATVLTGCGKEKGEVNAKGDEVVTLTWYQDGDEQKDLPLVLEKVNEYTTEKIGVKLKINSIAWGDYNQKMQVIINTGDQWDLAFTCAWANDYLQNAQKGAFLELDDYLDTYGKEMKEFIDPRFWDAAKINGVTYGVPSEKEIGSMPMWVFTKEYVDKYNIPYQDLHTLEDLEPWLKVIRENEPGVVPLYLVKDFSAPDHMDKIQNPVGIEYGDESLTVKNLFETEEMADTLRTIRKYYEAGYINKDAATAIDDKSIKRFITKGDGQPYAELIWSKDLGYDVVASPMMDSVITNTSGRGALTAINKNCPYPEKAVELLNLINTDEYLRNLLNYGIEGVHYEKVPLTEEEMKAVEGKPYVYDFRIKLNEEHKKDYSVPYWVQGGLFKTYVLVNEPADKWSTFKEFNDASVAAPSFGFDFDTSPVSSEVASFLNIRDEFGPSLYTGSVDPDEYLPLINKKLKSAGIDKVIEEMQKQIDEWKASKGQ